MEFKDRLRDLRKSIGLTQPELADVVKTTKQAISQYERGVRRPDFETLESLCDYFNVSSDYILGKSDVTVRLVDSDGLKKLDDRSARSIRIPVYGKVAAGYDYDAIENILGYEEIPASWSGEYAALKVKGNSMEPRIMDGDILIVKIQDDAESGDVVIAVVNGNEATVKKLVKHQDGIVLQPFNPAYEPMYFSKESTESTPVRIWGKVIENRQKY